jgi:tRNA modification GTPase
LFRGADLAAAESHRAHHGFAVDGTGESIDEVLALVLRRPRSYTGEDTGEFSCHGSPQIVAELVDAALRCGARLAEPGEFTRRAFLNGRIDLVQAEAVADLVAAHTRAARRSALEQLRGGLSARVRALRCDLLALLAEIEASIDFVEEDIEFVGRDAVQRRCDAARQSVGVLLATADDGVLLRSGIRVSLAGAPNVGKSSLFNAILRSSRSIVTEHAGTTRDVVRETLRLGGVLVQLEDTAGLRPSSADPVESIGIERSRQSHREADIVLFVVDASSPPADGEAEALAAVPPEHLVVALNKVDLLPAPQAQELARDAAAARHCLHARGGAVAAPAAVHPVSARTRAGVEALLDALVRHVGAERLALQNDAVVAINQRHRETLLRAAAGLETMHQDLAAGAAPELLAADLRLAVAALGEVSGEQVSAEILDAIFSRFCIGK